MKAIIPVAGAGTHLRPHTHTQPKPLIPVAGKPILGHIIDNLIQAGITDQVFVVGYLKEKIKDYVLTYFGDRINATFVKQEPRRGLGHALWVTRKEIVDEPEVLIVLGDTIFGDDTSKILEIDGSVLAVHPVDDPRSFGVAMLDEHRFVKKLVEKPDIPTSNLALVGLYKIAEVKDLLNVLDEMVEDEAADQLDIPLTDALMKLVKQGIRLYTHRVENWFDCGQKKSLLYTNQILLGRDTASQNHKFTNTVIIEPVHIADNCEIINSVIGPHVAIAENARIQNSIVKNSILGAYSTLDSIILNSSVIGNDTSLRGKSNSINIGDNTEIDFEQ
ncbi:MAG: NTP transferase domain-containing protein [Bacteroidia bacterium]|nr:NTP transferase domain-containing protein [Bacteroidia bacterium]